MLCCAVLRRLQAVLNNPDKVSYMKERIPLGRLGEPEDVVGEWSCNNSHPTAQQAALVAKVLGLPLAALQ
jgi:hypothetical protein